jgi:2-dehydropantoate 2-reductase
LVISAGSTGCYFGGRLAEAGRDVTFLVRPRRAARLRADGLVIHSPHGDLRLTQKLVTADALTDDYDLVLFAVKAYAAEQVIADIAPAIGRDTMILPMSTGCGTSTY